MPTPERILLPRGSGAKPIGHRVVDLVDGPREVPVYDRAQLAAGDRFVGPAIVMQLDATTFVAPHWQGEVHPSGAMLLNRSADAPRGTA